MGGKRCPPPPLTEKKSEFDKDGMHIKWLCRSDALFEARGVDMRKRCSFERTSNGLYCSFLPLVKPRYTVTSEMHEVMSLNT